MYVVPGILPRRPPFVPARYLVGFSRVTLRAGANVTVQLTIDPVASFSVTVDATGARGLVAGSYVLAVSRGVAGDELTMAVTVAA